jgi:PAS domain S-box-containing protein
MKKKPLKILIIGAGRRGTNLLEILSKRDDIKICAVVEIDEEAKGLKLAKSLSIPIYKDFKKAIKKFPVDAIFNVTGNIEVQRVIHQIKGPNVEVAGDLCTSLMDTLLIERDKNCAELAEKNAELDSILKSIGEGIVVVDKEKNVLLLNPPAKDILSFSLKKRKGKYFFPPDNQFAKFLDEIIHSPTNKVVSELTFQSKSGISRIYLGIGTKLKSKNKKVLGAVAIFRDISEEKEADKLRSNILSNVSHELRTPITSVYNSLFLLINETVGKITEDQRRILQIAKRNTDRLTRIVTNLLDISKIEKGILDLKMEMFNLKELIEEAVVSLKGLSEAKNIKVTYKLQRNLPPIYGNKEGVEHVLINLISNGIKFTPPGGSVSLYAHQKNDYIEVCVKDTGIGIPSENLEKIFEKFQQLQNPLASKTEGTGIGLSIVKYFIEAHKGMIWVESTPGRGSKFTFTLPLKEKYIRLYIEDEFCTAREFNLPFSFSLVHVGFPEDSKGVHLSSVFLQKIEEKIKEELTNKTKILRLSDKYFIILLKQVEKDCLYALTNLKESLQKWASKTRQTNLDIHFVLNTYHPKSTKTKAEFMNEVSKLLQDIGFGALG